MTRWSDALDLCSHGFKIFPLAENSKVPAIKGGHGCKDASDDEEILTTWIKTYPNANFGIATGEVSNIVVIDIDVKAAAGGEQAVLEFERKGQFFKPSCEAITPSGGRHLYYRYHPKVACNSAGKLAKGIDIRSTGGYVACPPSMIDGKPYRWLRHPKDGIKRLPAWIWVLLNPTPEPPRFKPEIEPDKNDAGLLKFVEAANEGERNARLFWAAKILQREEKSTDQLTDVARGLGLDIKEIRRTIKSAGKYVS